MGREHIQITASTLASQFPCLSFLFLTARFQNLLAVRNSLEVWGLKSFPVMQKLPSIAKATSQPSGLETFCSHLTFSQRQREEQDKDRLLNLWVQWTGLILASLWPFQEGYHSTKVAGDSAVELHSADMNETKFMVQGGLWYDLLMQGDRKGAAWCWWVVTPLLRPSSFPLLSDIPSGE